ncbi:PaaI family thioesterase [Ferrovibrio sp. MS7]|jgi:uncharacterized protein (TIGR00369 family)|uniref:PaaI family thioesterase n=1 Tax=Ferrovibrio plantarum TaxID=3119164 RepID=UPI003135648D
MDDFVPPQGFDLLAIKSGFVGLIGPFYLRRNGDEFVYGFKTVEHHGNVNGVMHGGVLFAFADTICGQYIIANLGRVCATVSMTSNFFSSANPGAWVEARPRIVKATRSLCYLTVELTAGDTPVYNANAIFKLFGPAAGHASSTGV